MGGLRRDLDLDLAITINRRAYYYYALSSSPPSKNTYKNYSNAHYN